MSKVFKILILIVILFVAGCSRFQPDSTTEPQNTEALQDTPTAVQSSQATETPIPQPSETPIPEPSQTQTGQPAPPTQNVNDLLSGDPIPLLSSSSDLILYGIQMINGQEGWGLTRVSGEGDHLLITTTGGRSWQDVTPPQPLSVSGQPLAITAGFADQATAFVHYAGTKVVWTTYNSGITWQPSAVTYESLQGGFFSVYDQEHAWLFQFLDGGMQKVYTALVRTEDGGESWETILDPLTDSSIQSFDKTGAKFINPTSGWLTRDFRGVTPWVNIDITQDGGETWEGLEMPPPPTDEDAFSTCACGLYNPTLRSPQLGNVRLTCRCIEADTTVIKNYLYQTEDGGSSWTISYVPEGTLHTISDQVYYLTSEEIYRSSDGGEEWDLVKSVNWQGQFSFVNADLAFAIAYDPVDMDYALVKTTDGCSTFQIIKPVLEASSSVR